MKKSTGMIAALALLTACGGGGASDGEAAAEGAAETSGGLPVCSEVWEVGATLPDPYEGCERDGEKVAPVLLSCEESGGEGRYVEWDGGTAYAREGGAIIDTVGELARICQ